MYLFFLCFNIDFFEKNKIGVKQSEGTGNRLKGDFCIMNG